MCGFTHVTLDHCITCYTGRGTVVIYILCLIHISYLYHQYVVIIISVLSYHHIRMLAPKSEKIHGGHHYSLSHTCAYVTAPCHL